MSMAALHSRLACCSAPAALSSHLEAAVRQSRCCLAFCEDAAGSLTTRTRKSNNAQSRRAMGSKAESQAHRAATTSQDRADGSTASSSSTSKQGSSENKHEVEKFARLAQQWWSPTGPFAALHALNSARMHFLRDAATACFAESSSKGEALQGLSVLDVGCGGGILAEPIARARAHVLGIDPSPESIGIAQQHAAQDPALESFLSYEQVSAEALHEQGRRFDVVVASEVIEHVRRPAEFVRTLAGLRKPGGCVVVTTINRTPESYALAIVAAEKVLGMAPDGAHDWNKFVTPQELAMLFERVALPMRLLAGMQLNLLRNEWQCTAHPGTNYAAMFCEAA